MNKIHKRRLIYIFFFALGLSLAATLILYALKQNMNVFLTPTELVQTEHPNQYRFRLGGMVKTGSIKRDANSLNVHFIVTDFKNDVPVEYKGIVPDLFREGKGVIIEGILSPNGIFHAQIVLAKHDENYMPQRIQEKIPNPPPAN